ncbi:MAG TPA: ABC transporter substrate-binding protein [Candidatus Nitrosotalea sp.]|nr:ABC transporter substrate-binding protein [Candidatus Nitrosotalea sp.]
MPKILPALASMAALLLAACGGAAAPNPAKSSSPVNVALQVAMNNPVQQPSIAWEWIGSYLGYYSQEGLSVNIVATSGPPDAIQRLGSGNVQVAVPPPGSILTAASQGRDLGLISPFMIRRHDQYQFAVLQGSSLNSAQDVASKPIRIGVTTLADEGVIYAKAVIKEYGGDPTRYQLIPVGDIGQAATELKNHQVDALSLPSAQYTEINGSLNFKLRVLPQTPLGDIVPGNAIWVTSAYLKAHPDVVKRYLIAFTKSLVFFLTNPKAAVEISFHMFPATMPKGQTFAQAVDSTVAQLSGNLPTLELSGLKCAQYGCNEKTAWDAYAYQYLGLSKSALPNTSKFYTNEFIQAANNPATLQAVVTQARKFKDLTS